MNKRFDHCNQNDCYEYNRDNGYFSHYGLLILIFNSRATTDRLSNKINGTVYPPEAVNSDEHAVAMNEAHIKLKFMMLRFAAKCFCP